MIFLLGLAIQACAGDDPLDAAVNGKRAVALNQSVNLDAAGAADPVEKHTPEGMPTAQTDDAATQAASETANATRVGPAHAGNGARMLTRAARNFDTHAGTPWYGTGLGALTIVLLMIGGVAWAARRWVPAVRAQDSNLVRVIGRTAVTPKHSVALFSVGRRLLMVGLCGDRLTTLGEITDADEVAELLARSGPTPKSQGGMFDELLADQAGEFRPSEDAANGEPVGPATRGAARYREPLNDLLRRLRTLQVK